MEILTEYGIFDVEASKKSMKEKKSAEVYKYGHSGTDTVGRYQNVGAGLGHIISKF